MENILTFVLAMKENVFFYFWVAELGSFTAVVQGLASYLTTLATSLFSNICASMDGWFLTD